MNIDNFFLPSLMYTFIAEWYSLSIVKKIFLEPPFGVMLFRVLQPLDGTL